MERIRRRCGYTNGFDVEADGSKGGLSLAWKKGIQVTIISSSRNHIDSLIKEKQDNKERRFMCFYGNLFPNERCNTWNLLRQLIRIRSHPWIVCGDFNEILYSFKKRGGAPREEKRMEAFHNVLEECQLMDVGFSGLWFTGERGSLPETNIRERLDRGVANAEWTTFRFEAWWLLESTFEKLVMDSWKSLSGPLTDKLEGLKQRIIQWAFQIKKDRKGVKQNLYKQLNRLLEEDRNDENLAEIIDTKIDLNLEIDKDEEHVNDKEGMATIAKNYFQDLFTSRGISNTELILDGVERCITEAINVQLTAEYTVEEICTALKAMGPTKAPGDDGFPAIFFQKCWHIVGKVCIDKAQSAFVSGRLIIDNVLVAYEIMHTLKNKRVGKKKGHMALKLDMSKVYDRVEWEFLRIMMERMGFAQSWGGKEVFIKLVLQAIPTYSMMCFLLSRTLCEEMGSLIARHWWQKGHCRKGIHWYDVDRILRIPLAREEHADMIVWCGEHSGKFIVRSAYKLLQTQTSTTSSTYMQNTTKPFYKQFWELQIPKKIKILVWKVSWNYIPTMANLYQIRVAPNDKCPRCRLCIESLWHIFVECLVSVELWKNLNFNLISQSEPLDFIEWLTWIFSKCREPQRQMLVCGIWVLWMDRNKNLHEGKSYTEKDAANYVRHYLGEIDGLNERKLKNIQENDKWKALAKSTVKINFDAFFDGKNHKSASAIVTRNSNGEIKISKSYLHTMVDTAFDAEAIACYEAVLTGIEMGFTDIIVEGDSKTIINKCMTQSVDKSQVSAYIRNIHREKGKFQAITFHFVPRSAD
ncbi:reverse transcriptase [Gossypium australe]|uniref:Reverse transcriptase n=1 Tax=Gossypium australe TaxID=47621 RepID=A0A5B6UZ25_9ROSI|nr:reverse transcriptase [Gossypium australe]